MNKDKFELKVNSNSVSWNAKSVLKLADENQKKFDKEREKYVKEIEKLKANGGGVSFINEKKPAEVMELQKENIYSYTPKFLKIDIQKLQEILKTKFSKFSDITLRSNDENEFHGFVLTGVGANSSTIWFRDYNEDIDGYFDSVYKATGVSIQKNFYNISNYSPETYRSSNCDGYILLSNHVYLPGFDTFSSDVQFVLIPITFGYYPGAQDFFKYESSWGADTFNNPFPYIYRSSYSDTNIVNDLIELYPKFQECLSLVEGIE